MQTGKIIEDINTLEDARKFESLMRWLGTRTREELRLILGLKKKAFGFLVERTGADRKDVQTEVNAFLAACASIRKHRPHNARTLEKIAQERGERKAFHPVGGPRTMRGKLEQDFETITALKNQGLTWNEIADYLRKSSTRYRGFSLKGESLRKTWARIVADETAPPTIPKPNPLASDSDSDENSLASEPVSDEKPELLPAVLVEDFQEPLFPERVQPPEPCGPIEPPFLSSPLG